MCIQHTRCLSLKLRFHEMEFPYFTVVVYDTYCRDFAAAKHTPVVQFYSTLISSISDIYEELLIYIFRTWNRSLCRPYYIAMLLWISILLFAGGNLRYWLRMQFSPLRRITDKNRIKSTIESWNQVSRYIVFRIYEIWIREAFAYENHMGRPFGDFY